MRKANQRRADILKLIDKNGNAKVEDLINKYQVSEETIRRDLRILDESGYVRRVYGGAVKMEKTTRYLPYKERLMVQIREKKAIGKECVKLLDDKDSIFIDGKTTCLMFANFIPVELHLTIVTNSVVLAYQLWSKKSNWTIHMVGGRLEQNGLLTGPKTFKSLQGFRFDKAFISCIGINETGCYFANEDAQQLSYTLREISSQLFLLADSSKINRHAFLFGLHLDKFACLITDENAPDYFVDKVKSKSCGIILAPLDDDAVFEQQLDDESLYLM